VERRPSPSSCRLPLPGDSPSPGAPSPGRSVIVIRDAAPCDRRTPQRSGQSSRSEASAASGRARRHPDGRAFESFVGELRRVLAGLLQVVARYDGMRARGPAGDTARWSVRALPTDDGVHRGVQAWRPPSERGCPRADGRTRGDVSPRGSSPHSRA
jgi:hypothetical protein